VYDFSGAAEHTAASNEQDKPSNEKSTTSTTPSNADNQAYRHVHQP